MNKAAPKIQRLRAAINRSEGDRVPVGEFFWTGFINRCKQKWGSDFDAYRYFDLDYIVMMPNMDPVIRQFDVSTDTKGDLTIKTGFGATIRRSGTKPMPHYEHFSVTVPQQMAKFQFDDPGDTRRFYSGGDDQINCVGDALARNIAAWDARIDAYKDDFCVFGAVCDPYEYLWRIIGSENALYWAASDQESLRDFINRIGDFMLEFAKAQVAAAKGRLEGMYIWGDVAYRNGMLFSPVFWREAIKPHVKALIDHFHDNGLMVIYHGCGDARAIYGDMIECGLDAYNPLEVKAGLDVVKLKKQYGSTLSFCGNIDVRILETGDPEAIKTEVLYKLEAARGGGWIFQSDHSISSDVAPESYELAIETLRTYGNYPLKLK